jgi:AcrR family transcriptional regulator
MNIDSFHELPVVARSRSSKRERRSVREESRAVYRQAIHEAALRVFGQLGFREAKIADIAAEAGVATGTLYNYFSSKEEIFQSIRSDGRDRLAAELDEISDAEPLDRIRRTMDTMFGFLEDHGVLFLAYIRIGGNPMDAKHMDEDREFREHFTKLITDSLTEAGERMRADIPTDALAWALSGLMHGAILHWIENGCGPGLREQTDTIMDIFLNGATPR